LLVGPPIETDEANWFLPVLGRLAQFAKDPEIPASLSALETPAAFLDLLESKGL
jgi:mannitol/fructose-specific phosphotransferase system IIA component (Ntr-type)